MLQSAYRQGHNTETALLKTHDSNLKASTTKETTTTNCAVKGMGRERRSRRENSRVKYTLAVDDEFLV